MNSYRSQKHNPKDKRDKDSPVEELQKKLESFKSRGLKDISADEIVSIADRMGRYLKELDLKTTQIRRFLDGIRKIDIQFKRGKDFNPDMVVLLKPKLAYAAGREPKKIKPLMQILDPAITAGASSYENFKKLVALIEGIVAYHRYYGGRDS